MSEKGIAIVPTCVPQSAEEIRACVSLIKPFASEIHIDIDDGRFAPVTTWPYEKAGEYGAVDLSMVVGVLPEIHLMVQDPRLLGIEFAKAGANRIIAHVEAFAGENDAHGALDAWKRHGAAEVGLAMLWDTPLEVMEHHKYIVDVVHLMSITRIGTQGIPYEPSAPTRIAAFHDRYPEITISVDGGVSETNMKDLVRAGARRFGVGAAIARAPDPAAAFQRLSALAEDALL
ncbi:MAG: hypothetical protein HYS26_04500 [Candidatus Kaiserbacteria bacterium]|nr:MAG: hypothetical protein HYS26_04500 [Candidatus Kaiserbacteria bacterium]